MKLALWSRRFHKWLAIVIGIQVLLWMLSGLYMTVIPIDTIRGGHLAQRPKNELDATVLMQQLPASFQQLQGIKRWRLKQLMGKPVYEVHHADGVALIDGASGTPLPPLGRSDISALALQAYQGAGQIESVALLDQAPPEVSTRPAPLWQVRFRDPSATSLYFSATSGDMLAKRHELWRWFDFLWMLHIMDYETRENINNWLLRSASILGALFAVSGSWLLFYSVKRRSKA